MRHPTFSTTPLQRQRGVVLVLVLWMLALFMVMVAGYSAGTHTEAMLTANQVRRAEGLALAEAGVWLALENQLQNDREARWPADGQPHSVQFAGTDITVRVQDEAGRIDLNQARPELLTGLFESAGVDPESASRLTAAVLDWRDRDNIRQTGGAESADYHSAGYPYGAKNGPFNTVEELRLVKGMTEQVFERVRPALTVYSHQSVVNGSVAVQGALAAVPGMDATLLKSYLSERGSGAGQSGIITGVDRRYLSGYHSRTISIISAATSGVVPSTIEAVMTLGPHGSAPYAVLAWRESPRDRVEPASERQ